MSEHDDRVDDLDLSESESEQVKGGFIWFEQAGASITDGTSNAHPIKLDPGAKPAFGLQSQKGLS
jgi:hypothetical protein